VAPSKNNGQMSEGTLSDVGCISTWIPTSSARCRVEAMIRSWCLWTGVGDCGESSPLWIVGVAVAVAVALREMFYRIEMGWIWD
jgi:hypothetical protein